MQEKTSLASLRPFMGCMCVNEIQNLKSILWPMMNPSEENFSNMKMEHGSHCKTNQNQNVAPSWQFAGVEEPLDFDSIPCQVDTRHSEGFILSFLNYLKLFVSSCS